MNKSTYRFKIGNFNCIAIYDGFNKYPNPVGILFPTAPKDKLKKALLADDIDADNWSEWIGDYTCLLVDTGTHKVLIDTGGGIPMPDTGLLLENLAKEGITPDDIDYVIISHGHPDHIGGLVDAEDKPAFPNARYVISKEEWEFWTIDPSLEDTNMDEMHKQALIWFAEKCLPPIREQLQLVEEENEIVPGILPVKAFGHTPGHLAFRIFSEGEELLYVGDAFINPLHMEYPEWNPVVDILPKKAVDTRRMLLNLAADKNAALYCFHFPFPCLGEVNPKGDTWHFRKRPE